MEPSFRGCRKCGTFLSQGEMRTDFVVIGSVIFQNATQVRFVDPHLPTQRRLGELCLPKSSSGMTRGWAYGNEATDGRVSTQLLLAIRSRFARQAQLEAEDLFLRQQLVVVLRRKSRRA